jgi:hypothetical protein
MRKLLNILLMIVLCLITGGWGFYGHKEINRLAVFTLPPEMIGFYKKHIAYLSETAVNPDRRRYAVVDEAPRHYIDLDHYGDSAWHQLPRYWSQAVEQFTEDTLKAYGILPWHLAVMHRRLRDAFLVGDPAAILKQSAELGHYIGDAHVPLHTTENYNGQLTGQDGIHGLWESRLPELFAQRYDYFVGGAVYIGNVQLAAWDMVRDSNALLDSVLRIEKRLGVEFGERKFAYEVKGRQTVRVYSQAYSEAYHRQLNGMVERRMRAAIRMTGSFWYTAWIDAGQPDLQRLIRYTPSEEELTARRREVEAWKQRRFNGREHE